jgi:hypothetical protein
MARYYRKKEKTVDYTTEGFQPCWTCKNACGKCSWSHNGTPVEGWKVEPVHIPENGEYADTFAILECPLYEFG